MTQLIFLVVVAYGGWMIYKRFIKDADKLTAKSRREDKERQTGAVGTLEKDPVTGEYRLKKDEDS